LQGCWLLTLCTSSLYPACHEDEINISITLVAFYTLSLSSLWSAHTLSKRVAGPRPRPSYVASTHSPLAHCQTAEQYQCKQNSSTFANGALYVEIRALAQCLPLRACGEGGHYWCHTRGVTVGMCSSSSIRSQNNYHEHKGSHNQCSFGPVQHVANLQSACMCPGSMQAPAGRVNYTI
jgi:hypothetical protein